MIGTTDCADIDELMTVSMTMGHKTSLTDTKKNIQGEKIAVCPGGGNFLFVVEEMIKNDVRTLITGVTIVNEYSEETHRLEKEEGINVLGGTHYSFEKFAPM